MINMQPSVTMLQKRRVTVAGLITPYTDDQVEIEEVLSVS